MGRLRDAWAVFMGSASLITPPEPTSPEAPKPMKISEAALAEANMSYGAPLNPWKLPDPPPHAKNAKLAMDSMAATQIANDVYAWASAGAFGEGLGFLGYPYLAELSQRPEYRHVVETWAAEATRKWIKLTGDPERVALIEDELEKFDVRALFRKASEVDGFFGRSQIFIDLGDNVNSDELGKPLIVNAKIGKDKVKALRVIEPFWSYPGDYESTNPLAAGFYKPRTWFVMTSTVHHTRMLTMVGREMPDMLKPAYSFGGLAMSQMIKPYVDNWLRTRQSVSDLLHSFSTMVLATDMQVVLAGGGADDLIRRAQLFNQTRDNRGLMTINKESEELTSVATPLGSVDKLQAQAQEQIASISGIPLVVLLGVTPSGLNASSDGEIQVFYDRIKAYQERIFRSPLATIIELLQLNMDGKNDGDIGFEFVDLWEAPDAEKAVARASDGDTDVKYVGAGIVDAEEVRDRIVKDKNSPYFGAELKAGAPDPPSLDGDEDGDGEADLPDDPKPDDDDKPGGGGKPPKPKAAADAEFKEADHPRAANGQFGSGGGSSSAAEPAQRDQDAPTPSPAKPPSVSAKVVSILGADGVVKLRELIADKSSKAADVLAALSPLDDAQRETAPTLGHNVEPGADFWNSRTYHAGGQDMNASEAKQHLQDVAAAYAGPDGVKQERRARILLGPPVAGKSTSAERIAATEGYAIVDGDDAKKVIPEFDSGVGASAVHEESGKLSEMVLVDMLDRGDNVALPLVGGTPGSIQRRIALLKSKGYSVTVDLVDVNEDEAARRMASRALRSGRHISSGYFASIGDGPKRTYEYLKASDPDNGYGRIDGNGGPRDEQYLEATNHPTATTGMRLFD